MKTITRAVSVKCGSCFGVGSIYIGFQVVCGNCKGSGEIVTYVEDIVDDEPEQTKETERGIEEIRFY